MALRLKVARAAAGLNQEDAAFLAGIPQPRWSQYERRVRRPSRSRLIRIATVLGWEGPPEALLEPVDENEAVRS